jgi:hypothetical protein
MLLTEDHPRIVLDAIIDALQPMIEPAHGLVTPFDARAVDALVREVVISKDPPAHGRAPTPARGCARRCFSNRLAALRSGSRVFDAIHVVNVFREGRLGGGDGENRLQRRRSAHGHLDRVGAAPGDAKHGDLAVRPALPCEPRDDAVAVLLLLR